MFTTDSIPYTGPAYHPATGAIDMGPGQDGGHAAWQLYAEDTMLSGFISHRAGMGASRLLDLIGHSALATGNTVVWHADLQRGLHSPALAAAADRAAGTPDQVRTMIFEVCGLAEDRAAAQRRRGERGFTPSPGDPGLLILVEEFGNVVADPAVRAALEQFTADRFHRFEHLGIAFAVTVQHPELRSFGHSEPIRRAVGHNQVYLHQASRLSELRVDVLDRIPAVPGYGCHRRATDHGAGELTVFRARHLGEAEATRRWFAALPAGRPVLARA